MNYLDCDVPNNHEKLQKIKNKVNIFKKNDPIPIEYWIKYIIYFSIYLCVVCLILYLIFIQPIFPFSLEELYTLHLTRFLLFIGLIYTSIIGFLIIVLIKNQYRYNALKNFIKAFLVYNIISCIISLITISLKLESLLIKLLGRS